MKYFVKETGKEVRMANVDGVMCYVDIETNEIVGKTTEVKTIDDSSEETAVLGAEVRQYRNRAGIVIKDAIAILNTGKGVICDFENGKHSVSLNTLLRMGDLYGFEVVLQPKAKQ